MSRGNDFFLSVGEKRTHWKRFLPKKKKKKIVANLWDMVNCVHTIHALTPLTKLSLEQTFTIKLQTRRIFAVTVPWLENKMKNEKKIRKGKIEFWMGSFGQSCSCKNPFTKSELLRKELFFFFSLFFPLFPLTLSFVSSCFFFFEVGEILGDFSEWREEKRKEKNQKKQKQNQNEERGRPKKKRTEKKKKKKERKTLWECLKEEYSFPNALSK